MNATIREIVGDYDTQDKFVNCPWYPQESGEAMDSSYRTNGYQRPLPGPDNHVLNLGKTTIREAVAMRDELVNLMSQYFEVAYEIHPGLSSALIQVFPNLTSVPKGYVIESVSATESNVALKHDENQDAEGVRFTLQRALDKGQLLEIVYEKKEGERSTKRIRVKELKPWGVRARTVQGDRSYNWEKIITAEVVSEKNKKAKNEPTYLFAISINRSVVTEGDSSSHESVTSIFHRISLHLVNNNLVLIDLHRDDLSGFREPWQL